MALSLLKLMNMTGPLGFPVNVELAEVQGPERVQLGKLTLIPNDEIQRTLFQFDNQTFVPFQNPALRLGMNAAGGLDLGQTIIFADDVNGELTTRFHPEGGDGPFYELTCRVLPP